MKYEQHCVKSCCFKASLSKLVIIILFLQRTTSNFRDMRGFDLHLSYIPALTMRHKCEITRNILRQKKTTEAEQVLLSTQL